ncbi:MAG: diguanylate cyclase [Gammaproteobacteria bacterium]|nr:diguanylate cyclase [Gammaproteobacteria bacterium]MBU1654312.1 diguanylate cyclase [Gammaproteobacteria bacterium]MBU1961213.1 diguanylate cyclase [Gammaproteobacteria bacterium]
MSLTRKTTLFFVTLASLVIIALMAIGLYSFRHIYLKSVENQAKTAAEIVRVYLTEAMLNGTIDKRKQFMDRLNAVHGLLSADLFRGPDVVAQHGPGLQSEQAQDAVTAQVIASGKPYFGLIERDGGYLFRASIPYKAQNEGTPNCLSCHKTRAGTVLGVISLHISVEEQRIEAAWTVGIVIAVISFFALGAAVFSLRTARPLIAIAGQVQETVDRASKGDYRGRIETDRNDELGQIAASMNRLMAHLSEGLTAISGKVAQLIRYNMPPITNLLDTTIEMVDCLGDVAAFKQAIEEDETTEEVYARLSRILREEFLVDHFSIYEVSHSKNRMQPVVVDGAPDQNCRWCDPQILLRADGCRAKRTGHPVDSVMTPDICTAFSTCGSLEGCRHVCIPVIQSGSVGSVVQLITDGVQAPLLQKMMPFIQVYLRESAPVLESKRLMDSLRENSLRDPMTGLHNRRFLQEYADTLTTYSDRKKSSFAVLMADMDYFKQVNDTYGHEAGDTTLKQLAMILRESTRASDLVIRYGGEEFLILLRDLGEEAAMATAEKIRDGVEKHRIQLAGAVINKTISIGVAIYPDDSTTFWQVVKYADVALYRAKEAGRNRVLHFQPEMWTEQDRY